MDINSPDTLLHPLLDVDKSLYPQKTSSSNTITIKAPDSKPVPGNVAGGYSNKEKVTFNTIDMKKGKINRDIYGGLSQEGLVEKK